MATRKILHDPAMKGAVKHRGTLTTVAGQEMMRLRPRTLGSTQVLGAACGHPLHPENLGLGANLDLWMTVVLIRPWFNPLEMPALLLRPMAGGYRDHQEISLSAGLQPAGPQDLQGRGFIQDPSTQIPTLL